MGKRLEQARQNKHFKRPINMKRCSTSWVRKKQMNSTILLENHQNGYNYKDGWCWQGYGAREIPTCCWWEYIGTITLENSLILSAKVDDTHNPWASNSSPGYRPNRNVCPQAPGTHTRKNIAYLAFNAPKQIIQRATNNPMDKYEQMMVVYLSDSFPYSTEK